VVPTSDDLEQYVLEASKTTNPGETMNKPKGPLHILAVDCCSHVLAALDALPQSRLTQIASKHGPHTKRHEDPIDLIVIGVSRYPVRRLFISQLRKVYPDVPVMILRREPLSPDTEDEVIRAEFILSDQGGPPDLEIVDVLRGVMPLEICEDMQKGFNYDVVREVIRVIAQKYPDPNLDLHSVASELPISATQLSRILNQQVGVSFRQLLRHVRIEEAKRMLASKRFSVKEVAARVGFTDSHYFSRSFKEFTGLNATDYKTQDAFWG
jgi:AraC-like DNA-binding protein